jgi:hypothetical protein
MDLYQNREMIGEWKAKDRLGRSRKGTIEDSRAGKDSFDSGEAL